MTRILLALVAALCAGTLVPGGGAATQKRPFTLVLPRTTSTYVDLGRHGYSAGDFFLTSGRLLADPSRTPTGRLGGTWTILSRQADHAAFTIGLDDGALFVTGRIVHAAPSSTLALTGGTGAYAAARGTVVFRYMSRTSATLEVRLRG